MVLRNIVLGYLWPKYTKGQDVSWPYEFSVLIFNNSINDQSLKSSLSIIRYIKGENDPANIVPKQQITKGFNDFFFLFNSR